MSKNGNGKHRRKPVTPVDTVCIEHLYAELKTLPPEIHEVFPQGACAVFADQNLVAAIPASEQDTVDLRDAIRKSQAAYIDLRDKLCGERKWETLAQIFKRAMTRMKSGEEGKEL